jgi:hypothetical protein
MLNKIEWYGLKIGYVHDLYARVDGEWFYPKNARQLLKCSDEISEKLEKEYKETSPPKQTRKRKINK